MTRFVHTLARTLLCLTLALAGVTMASAHGPLRGGAGSIVICSGGQAVSVRVDATGTPLEPAPTCPDCALCGVVSTAPGGRFAEPTLAEHRLSFVIEPAAATGLDRAAPRARGPPRA